MKLRIWQKEIILFWWDKNKLNETSKRDKELNCNKKKRVKEST